MGRAQLRSGVCLGPHSVCSSSIPLGEAIRRKKLEIAEVGEIFGRASSTPLGVQSGCDCVLILDFQKL